MCEGKTGNQERNIMILFLSNLHGDWVKKANNIYGWTSKKSPYVIYNQKTVECRETNEAPLKDILEFLKTDEVEHRYLDAVFCFATNRVRNCDKDGNQQRAITIKKVKNKDEQDELDGMEWTSASDEEFFWEKRAQIITGLIFRKAEKIEDIKEVPENTVWRISVPFNEVEGGPVNSAIKAVTEMETAIKAYLKHEGVPITKCNIYADTTGGFRPANMAMSAVMQLLGYQEAKLRRVVYSDGKRVSNVQPIDDMYRLVAGVDAFTKYGSSAALDEYFADVKKDCPPLRELLDAMNAFSESVLLCQPNDIVENLKKLVPKLENFKKNLGEEQNPPTKVALFERMIDELKEIYMLMYAKEKPDGTEREADRLEIIQWCIDNSLLQQAVTFCTEWLPEYLVDWGAVYSDDKAVQQYCAKELADYRTWKKNLLMQFCTQKVYKPDKEGKSSLDRITDIAAGKEVPRKIRALIVQEALRQNMGIDFDEGDVPTSGRWAENLAEILSKLEHFLRSLTTNLERLKNVQRTNRESIMAGTKLERKLLKRIYKKPWEVVVHEKPLTKLTASVFQDMYKWNLRAFETFFAITNCEYRYIGNYDYNKKAEDDYRTQEYCLHRRMKDKTMNAAAISHAMFDCGILKTDLPRNEEALHFILHYSYIRTELRNKMNHSSEDDEKKKGKKQDGELQNDMEAMSEARIIKEEKTQEEYIPMKIQSIKKYLAGYLGEVKHLRDVLQNRYYLSVTEASK